MPVRQRNRVASFASASRRGPSGVEVGEEVPNELHGWLAARRQGRLAADEDDQSAAVLDRARTGPGQLLAHGLDHVLDQPGSRRSGPSSRSEESTRGRDTRFALRTRTGASAATRRGEPVTNVCPIASLASRMRSLGSASDSWSSDAPRRARRFWSAESGSARASEATWLTGTLNSRRISMNCSAEKLPAPRHLPQEARPPLGRPDPRHPRALRSHPGRSRPPPPPRRQHGLPLGIRPQRPERGHGHAPPPDPRRARQHPLPPRSSRLTTSCAGPREDGRGGGGGSGCRLEVPTAARRSDVTTR